jgi:hypothetical protein
VDCLALVPFYYCTGSDLPWIGSLQFHYCTGSVAVDCLPYWFIQFHIVLVRLAGGLFGVLVRSVSLLHWISVAVDCLACWFAWFHYCTGAVVMFGVLVRSSYTIVLVRSRCLACWSLSSTITLVRCRGLFGVLVRSSFTVYIGSVAVDCLPALVRLDTFMYWCSL